MLKKSQIRTKISERDILSLSFVSLTIFSLFVGFISYISARSCSNLAQGATKATLVQQIDGTSFLADSKPSNYREPLVVRNYVKKWVTHTFDLSGELQIGEQKIIDQGIELWGRKIPTNVVSGSYAWSANKRKAFVQAYLDGGLVPEDYFKSNGSTTQEVEIDFLGSAELVDPEKQIFSVKVIATISEHEDGRPTGNVDFWRQDVFVASAPIPQKKPDAQSIYQQLSYEWRKEGLRIEASNPFK